MSTTDAVDTSLESTTEDTQTQENLSEGLTQDALDNLSGEEHYEYLMNRIEQGLPFTVDETETEEQEPTSIDPQPEPTDDGDDTDGEDVPVETQEKVEEEENTESPEDNKTKEEVAPTDKFVATDEHLELLEQLFTKGFKANKQHTVIQSVEDVVPLLQKAYGFTKKTQEIAKGKKLLTTLEQNQVDETELSFLLDVKSGNTEAIKALLVKHGIDPLALDVDEVSYQRNTNNLVSDNTIEFTEAVNDIRGTETATKMNTLVNTTWDSTSKTKILGDPKLFTELASEIESGRFDAVQAQVEYDRATGKLPSTYDDITAYATVMTSYLNNPDAYPYIQSKLGVQKPTPTTPEPTNVVKPATPTERIVKTDVDVDKSKAVPSAQSGAPRVKQKYTLGNLPEGLSDEEHYALVMQLVEGKKSS